MVASARASRSSPATVHPLLEVRSLRADRGVEAMAGEDQQVGGEREQSSVDRLDDLREVATGALGVPGAPGEERVAAEQDGVALEQERRGAGRVARVVDGAETEI